MERMPPRITTAVSTVITAPVIQGETRNVSCASERDRVRLHHAADAEGGHGGERGEDHGQPAQASGRARARTSARRPSCPAACVTRYFTASTASAYLVAMPKTPVSHIQSTAPGPPARDRRGHADDVAGADGRGERGRQRAELRDVALALPLAREREADGLRQVALDEAQPDGQEEVRAEEQDEQRRAPDQVAHPPSSFSNDSMPHLRAEGAESVVRPRRQDSSDREKSGSDRVGWSRACGAASESVETRRTSSLESA